MALRPGYSSIYSKLECDTWRLWGGDYDLMEWHVLKYKITVGQKSCELKSALNIIEGTFLKKISRIFRME